MENYNNNGNENESSIIIAPKKYNIIYVYKINDPTHNGLVKIGKTSFNSDDVGDADIKNLPDDSPLLIYLAKKRIEQQTKTSANDVKILYCTLGIKDNGDYFDDNKVDEWLEKNNCKHEENLNGATEWYRLSIDQVKRAINAVKSGMDNCDIESELQLNSYEEEAIKQTFAWYENENRYFWQCEKELDILTPTLFLIKKSQLQPVNKFNHIFIICSTNQIGEEWFKYFNLINLSSSTYFFYQKEIKFGGIQLKKDDKINEENKFICYLDFRDWEEFKDTICMYRWDLIIIDELTENITTNFENKISECSPNAKWLYLTSHIPAFSLLQNKNDIEKDAKESLTNNEEDFLQTPTINSNDNICKTSLKEEKIYFITSAKKLNLHFTKPEVLVIDNSYSVNCKSWSGILIDICTFLLNKFGLEVFARVSPKDISRTGEGMRSAHKINGVNCWVETNYDASTAYQKCRDLLELFNIPLEKSYLIIRRMK